MKRVLCATALWLAALAGASAAEVTYPTLPLGAPAPDFKLPGVNGRTYALKDFAAAPALVIVFTCNHCPTAQYYEERLKQLAADYSRQGVAVVAISPNDPQSVRLDELGWSDLSDSFEEMKLRAKDRQFNFPYLYDGDTESVARAYGPVTTPHAFVFDAARKLRYVGRIDDSERPQQVKARYVRDAVAALLAGKEPPLTQTKPIGCSVKWGGKAESVKAYLDKLAAEPVTLTPVDAGTLEALRKNPSGKFRLVAFWATTSAPCVAGFHEFVTINRMYRHRDFELVTVSLNGPGENEDVLDFLRQKQAASRNLIFAPPEKERLIKAFEPEWSGLVPYTVLISPEGEIIVRQLGNIEPLALRRAIVKAMNERKPW